MKKIISFMLSIVLLLSFSINTYAFDYSEDLQNYYNNNIFEIFKSNFEKHNNLDNIKKIYLSKMLDENLKINNALTLKELKTKVFDKDFKVEQIVDSMVANKVYNLKINVFAESVDEYVSMSDIILKSGHRYIREKYPWFAMEFIGFVVYHSSSKAFPGKNTIEICMQLRDKNREKTFIDDYDYVLKTCKDIVIDFYTEEKYNLSLNSSDYDKMKVAFEWLCKYTDYDYTYKNESASSLLRDKKGICQSYTAVYNLLLKYMGIDSLAIGGVVVSNDEGHCWTEVSDENGDLKYIDTTWGDTGSNKADYKWFYVDKSKLTTGYNRRVFD